jgi:hypothetical protein
VEQAEDLKIVYGLIRLVFLVVILFASDVVIAFFDKDFFTACPIITSVLFLAVVSTVVFAKKISLLSEGVLSIRLA